MASKKRGRKTKTKTKRGRRKTVRASTALRVGAIVTRKLSPATLKKHGLKLKAAGTFGGKKAYKVVRTSSGARAAKKASRRWRETPAAKANRAFMDSLRSADDKKIVPGAILSAGRGATMRWVTFYRVDKREGDRVVLTSLGQKYAWGDAQGGGVVPVTSETHGTYRGKVVRGSIKVGYDSWAYPWNGKPESVYGD